MIYVYIDPPIYIVNAVEYSDERKRQPVPTHPGTWRRIATGWRSGRAGQGHAVKSSAETVVHPFAAAHHDGMARVRGRPPDRRPAST